MECALVNFQQKLFPFVCSQIRHNFSILLGCFPAVSNAVCVVPGTTLSSLCAAQFAVLAFESYSAWTSWNGGAIIAGCCSMLMCIIHFQTNADNLFALDYGGHGAWVRLHRISFPFKHLLTLLPAIDLELSWSFQGASNLDRMECLKCRDGNLK